MRCPGTCNLLLGAALGLCLPESVQAATVDKLDLGVGVYDGASGVMQSDGIVLTQNIPNPFQTSHSAALGGSTALASYDFAWWDTNGTFIIQSTQTAEGVPTSLLFTAAAGYIYLTPAEDLALAIDASWTYDLPGDPMFTRFSVRVSQSGGSTVLFSQSHRPETLPGEPAAGTLAITGNVVLPRGETWLLRYEMSIYTYGGTQGHTATGNGYVNFQLAPEPASAAILALGLLIVPRRRHSRRIARRSP